MTLNRFWRCSFTSGNLACVECSFIYITSSTTLTQIGLVWFYSTSTIVGYWMPNPVEESSDGSVRRLEDYIKTNRSRLISVTRNKTNNAIINRTTITWKQKGEEKQLYGYFKRQTNEISHEKTWTWQRKGNVVNVAEYLLTAARNQHHKN